jgi:hypothetical protein
MLHRSQLPLPLQQELKTANNAGVQRLISAVLAFVYVAGTSAGIALIALVFPR